jgi:hypothetical protein
MKAILVCIGLLIAAPLFLTQTLAQDRFSKTLLEKARQGDFDAQNELGIAYSEGRGVKSDQLKAVYWFRRSAEQGYAIGACNLALHYGRGWGVPRNKTLLMKYVFAAHALDGLKCHPADYIQFFKTTECQIERGWELAVEWLKAHIKFRNNFGDKPWMEANSEYPITIREGSAPVRFPINSRCKRTRTDSKRRNRASSYPVDAPGAGPS